MKLGEWLENNVPVETRGDYAPWDVSISIGTYEIKDYSIERTAATVYFQIMVLGDGHPPEADEYLAYLIKSPPYIDLGRKLNELMGCSISALLSLD
jgi:hypothetical protein